MKYYKLTQHNVLHSIYCMIYACAYVYGKVIFDGLDWFGKKLVDLIDHSDFFAGIITTVAVISIWELLTK